MKQGTNPTRKQKLAIAAMRLNPDNWLVIKALAGELHIVHRSTRTTKIIPL